MSPADPAPAPNLCRRTWLLALVVAIILTAARAIADWPQLAILRLPDNDDLMRLAEVQDWVRGQGFHDLVQHRLGMPPGASMHWSRIADVGPALILRLFSPLVGERAATLIMLVLYQGLLFFAYLLLAARNARFLVGERAMPVGVILAALAFPTVSLFSPGRIDHHALQIVLTMVMVGAIVAPSSWRAGIEGGLAASLSLAVGLEVAPELLAAFAAIGLGWIFGGKDETPRLAGLGATMGLTTLGLLLFARPDIWPAEWCDGFTPASTNATFGASIALAALALVGMRWRGAVSRFAAAALVGAVTAAWVFHASRVCLMGPYGALDPFLKHAFMDNVSEAKDLFFGQDTVGTSIAYGGLGLASLVALMLVLRDSARRARWWPFAVFLAISMIVLILQIRVSYILAGIATLPFVALMDDAGGDEGGLVRRLAIWVLGAGFVYNLAGVELDRALSPPPLVQAKRAAEDCTAGGPLLALARQPRGNVMAPLDSGAYIIGMTPQRSFAAGYHRNNAGNMAMYRFFLSSPDKAAAMARALDVRYVVSCENSLREDYVDRLRRGSLIEALQAGRPPAWLRRIIWQDGGMTIYRVIR